MDLATARVQLIEMVAATSAPVLTSDDPGYDDIAALLVMSRRRDANGRNPYDNRAALTLYVVGDLRVPTVVNGYYYRVSTAGTSGGPGDPTWPTSGAVMDGSVAWTVGGRDLWVPTYDLRAAAAEGWRRKAAKVAGWYDFSADGATFNRAAVLSHCTAMVKAYQSGGVSSIRLVRS